MPKYGIHHIVMKEAVQQLYGLGTESAQKAAQLLENELSSAYLGAIGPDLFFWGTDYKVVDKLYQLYKNIESIVALYDQIMQPIREIKDAVVEPVEDLIESLAPNTIDLIQSLVNQINETAALFHSAVATGIFAGVLEGADLVSDAAGLAPLSHEFFKMFVPALQFNHPEDKWYWFDMLHYRGTGIFAANLGWNAKSPIQKAYAYGYLSHIATDVVGHAYVNTIVGAPYRLNVQRHVIAENYMDAWKYARYYPGESINHTLLSNLSLPTSLPKEIGDMLYNAFIQTYTDIDHPKLLPGDGFYTRSQIDQTYEVFYKVLKLLESMAIERPQEPFSGVGAILANALDQFAKPPEPPDISTSSCSVWDILALGITESSRDCFENFFEDLANWLNYMGELIRWTIETFLAILDLLSTLLLSLPICVLLALLYGIQLLCYQLYRSARLVLVTNGFVMPEPDELDNSIGRNLTTLFQACGSRFNTYPSIGTPYQSHLVCPIAQAEYPNTIASLYPIGVASTPDRFIRQESFNENAVRIYAMSHDPAQTRSHAFDRLSIGNATDFTAWMIAHAEEALGDNIWLVFADWNLDSDRGYAYRNWRGKIPNSAPWMIEDEKYMINF